MRGLSLNTARDGGHIRLQEGFVKQNKRYGVDQTIGSPLPANFRRQDGR